MTLHFTLVEFRFAAVRPVKSGLMGEDKWAINRWMLNCFYITAKKPAAVGTNTIIRIRTGIYERGN